ncbi:Y+L amino acid transporter 2 isoform X1 [Folsomia candida]|uniref:Y+L amino acid transporter 2 isoform X1 n=1 Tax=Folsomia candida TaxID=158441 RepID=UPI000B8FB49E|nr:Y+L amino acid transporter 2 isoform X1 [Folsomia candida]
MPSPHVVKHVIKLRKQIGLLEATSITVGSIIGSGIFISPKGVIDNAGSVGLSLLLWILCGLQAGLGAICYAELGTSLPGSGGDYHYLNKAFGNLPAFTFLWVSNIILLPASNAVMSLTFAHYTFASFFNEDCKIPQFGVQLLACCAVLFLTWFNVTNVKAMTKMQNVFMIGKIAALIVIIFAGVYSIAQGHTKGFENIWKNTTTEPGKIAVGFYSGTFAYSGWNALCYITEELKSPNKNLPRAIYISMPIVTLIYVLTNVAYFSVLSPHDIHASDAIAVTFGNKVQLLRQIKWMIPLFVAMSSFGCLSVHIMSASRILFAGARNGHFPGMLSLIQMNQLSPVSSLIFMGGLSVVYLSIPDVFVLITFATFIFSLVSLVVVIAMLYLRWKQPELPRPIKVHILYPLGFMVICIFLTVFPIFVRPYEVLIGLAITFSSIPVYLMFFVREQNNKWLVNNTYNATVAAQKLLLAVPEEAEG